MRQISQIEPWIGEEEKQAVVSYLDSGGWLTEFRQTEAFEKQISEYVGSAHTSIVSNGTISLMIALMALDIGQGSEVIVPDFTMIASANGVVMSGATPVLVDIDPVNLCLDLDAVEAAIGPKTRAIMLVSINGRSPDMHRMMELADRHNLKLVEDAAQSLGSRYEGKHLGTFGQIGSFSFSFPKVITTGQGGALVTDDPDLHHSIELIKDFGRPRGGVDYHERFGFNSKFTDLQAVIGIEQMKKLPWRVERKKEMFRLYRQMLEGVEGLTWIETDLEDVSPWFIDVLVEGGRRDDLQAFLKENGVGSRPFYPAIHSQPPYAHVNGDFRNSDSVSERGLWLPSSSFLTDDDVECVCSAVSRFFSK